MRRQNALPIYSPFAVKCFETVFNPLRNFRLGDIHFLKMPLNLTKDCPVILVGNHVSNWDGFLFRELQRKLFPEWPIYSIMLEKEMKRLPFFRWLGGIGIKPDSAKSIATTLRALKQLRQTQNEFFLSYFPQGKIFPSFKSPLGFKEGIDLFVNALSPVTLLPIGLHMEPMKKLTPTYFISVGEPFSVETKSNVATYLETLVENEIKNIHHQLVTFGEAWEYSSPNSSTFSDSV